MTAEPPIYIGYAHHGDCYNYLDSGIPIERRPLRAVEVWTDYDSIPPTPPVPAPFPGSVGVFTNGILDEPLVATVDPLEFATNPTGRLALIMPGNILNQAYRPILRDAAGREIPYDPSIWVADGIVEVVCFKERSPTAMGYRLPLSMTYWVYTGGVAGTSAGLGGLANVGSGIGIYDTTIANVARLRTLNASNGVALSQVANNITFTLAQTVWRICEIKEPGIPGGSATPNSTTSRELNLIESDGPDAGLVTLDGIRISFAAGRYAVTFQAPADSDSHRCFLAIIPGNPHGTHMGSNAGNNGGSTTSIGYAIVRGPGIFSLEHYLGSVPADPFTSRALGWADNSGFRAIYSQVLVTYLGPPPESGPE